MQAYLSMDDFLSNLKAFEASRFNASEVHEYLRETLIKPDSLETYICFRPDCYTRNLVYKSEAFELLVICWGVGQEAPIHGHEGEYCWSRVEKGSLRFTNYREVSEVPLVLDKLGEPVDGKQGHLDGPAIIHEVTNPSSFGETAVSLHVYSHPFEECDIYDLAKGEKHRMKLAYDTMFGNPVSPLPS